MSQNELRAWLLSKDRPFAERSITLRSHGKVLSPAEQTERAIIATLNTLVLASDLPKYLPGTVGKPRPSMAEIPEGTTPVSDLAEVMPEHAWRPPEWPRTEEEPEPVRAETSAPPAGRHPIIQGIIDEGARKLAEQRARAESMRQAKYAKQRARKAAAQPAP